jgi:hypothetical protein
LEILARRNPTINERWTGVSYANTTSAADSFDEVVLNLDHPNMVRRWEDFTFEAIHLAYGDLLTQDIAAFRGKLPELAHYQQVNDPPLTPTIINDEGDIDTLGIVWMCPIIRGPLKAASHVLRARPGMTAATKTSATIAPKKVEWKAPAKKKPVLSGKPGAAGKAEAAAKVSYSSLKPDWVSFLPLIGAYRGTVFPSPDGVCGSPRWLGLKPQSLVTITFFPSTAEEFKF